MTPKQILQEIHKEMEGNSRLVELLKEYGKSYADAALRRLYVTNDATLHIRPTESFLKAQTPNREHYTLTLNPTDFSDYSGGSS